MSKPTKSKRTPLALAREKRGWTQAYVAEQVGVSIDAVRQWERGRHLPYQATIQKLCNLFEMTPEGLGLLKEQYTPAPLAREEILVYTDKTETRGDHEPLAPQATNSGPTLPSEATRLTTRSDFSLLQSIQGTWEPNEEEKKAAWEIYVELVTRIPIAVLGQNEGILREALSSMYSLFHTTRTILRSHSPAIARRHAGNNRSLSYLVICMLNTTLRPLLGKWHPLLKAYEETRPNAVGITEYEQRWERCTELRQEITRVHKDLAEYAHIFAQIAEVSSLTTDISEVQEIIAH